MKKKSKKGKRHGIDKRDADKLRNKAERNALSEQNVILLSVLRDKFGFGKKRLNRVWQECEKISREISAMNGNAIVRKVQELGIKIGDEKMASWNPVALNGKMDNIRAKQQAKKSASEITTLSQATSIMAIRNTEKYGKLRLNRILREIRSMTDSVHKKFCSVADLENTLKTESGITFIEKRW